MEPITPEPFDEIDPDELSDSEDSQPLFDVQGALKQLRERCFKANLKTEDPQEESSFLLKLSMPEGRDTRPVYIRTSDAAQALLDIPFERFVFLSNYDAVCSYEHGFIEAALSSLGLGSSFAVRRRLFGIATSGDLARNAHSIEIVPSAGSDIRAQLHLAPRNLRPFSMRFERGPFLMIEGLSISNHDQAVQLLETVADALFFEIDIRFNIPLGLRKVRRPLVRPLIKSDELSRKPLQFPNCRYDREPASLYWYGRSATGMPLLQFLAFYQAIEYYFPVYSQNEAIKHVRALLKNPSFSIHDDTDISRLLSAVQIGKAGGFGDERTQFRSTILNCIDARDLREFLGSDERFTKFYTTQQDWKAISTKKIPINNADADLRNDVADRIYDIRCKIVHAKSDGGPANAESLLPFSKEADSLSFDIEVTRYVARQVLIVSSSPLKI